MGNRLIRIVISRTLIGLMATVSILLVLFTGPASAISWETRDAMLSKAKTSANGNWIASADGGWRYKRFTKGYSYTGVAYTQNNPQESWWTFSRNMANGFGAPGNDQGADCSGWLSWTWNMSRNTTYTFLRTSYAFKLPSYDSLFRGDALVYRNSGGGHIGMFDRRLDSGYFMVYEQTTPHTLHRRWSWSNAAAKGYVPLRRTKIVEEWVPPSGYLTSPATGQTILTGKRITVRGQFTDNRSVADVDFYAHFDPDGGGPEWPSWRLIGSDDHGGNGDYMTKWTVTAPPGAQVKFKAVPHDATGNEGTTQTTPVIGGVTAKAGSSVFITNGVSASPSIVSIGASSNLSFDLKNLGSSSYRTGVRVEKLSPAAKFTPRWVWESGRAEWWSWRSKMLSGDFNGDGKDDIAAVVNEDKGTTAVYVIISGREAEGPQFWWRSGAGYMNWYETRPSVGDFNGDGFDDIALMKDTRNKTAELWVLKGSESGGFDARLWWDENRTGFWNVANVRTTAADLDGDGASELIAFYGYGGGNARMFVFKPSGSSFEAPVESWRSSPGTYDVWRTKLLAGDFDNDGSTEVAAVYDAGSSRTAVWVFDGPGGSWAPGEKMKRNLWFDSAEGGPTLAPSRVKPMAGDITGEGRDDIALLYDSGNNTATMYVLASEGNYFNTPKVWWKESHNGWWSVPRSSPVAGDINGDGRADISTIYDYNHGQARLWQHRSGRVDRTYHGYHDLNRGQTTSISLSSGPLGKGTAAYSPEVKQPDGTWAPAPALSSATSPGLVTAGYETPRAAKVVAPEYTTDVATWKTVKVSGWKSGAVDSRYDAGITGFDIRYQKLGDPGWTMWKTNTDMDAFSFWLADIGATYCLSARAKDSEGRTGPWAEPSCVTSPLDDTNPSQWYSSGWVGLSGVYGFHLGTLHYSTTKGAKTTLNFTGESVAWIGTKGPYHGLARVYLDNVLMQTVDLYSPTWKHRQVLFENSWNVEAAHTIKIEVVGAKNPKSGWTRVDWDGVAVR